MDFFKKFGSEYDRLLQIKDTTKREIRCCIPAKIISVDYSKMTCSCQPLLRERMESENNGMVDVDLPLLVDVPIVFQGSSSFSITFPLNVGDEGIVIFSDMCIDSWWQSGDIQNQFEIRRHDLSDGMFIPSQMSQAKKYQNVSNQYLQIKNRSTGTNVEIRNDAVYVDGLNVKKEIEDIKDDIRTFKDRYNSHVHGYSWDGEGGSSNTSGPK